MVTDTLKQNMKYLMMTQSPGKLFFVFSLIAALLFSTAANAADIQVRVDRNDIELNETFTLVFEASGAVDGDPDFSPLQQDFQILNTSTGSNISIINGQYTRSQRWSLTLMAIREGKVTIPSIQFGKDTSPAYQLTIKAMKQSSGKSGDEFISELEINTDSTYPQGQILVTQRLLSSRNISAYEFSPLQFSGVEVATEPLGKPGQYQIKRGDTPYLVLEQRYALFPQTSGTLIIEPSIASARVTLNNARSPFDPFRSNTKTVRRASERKSIEIQPIPAAFKGKHWLVAQDVQLLEEFPENTEFKVGEPITRTLSLMVDGQSASQLPEFKLVDIDGLKQYPDQPVNDNTISGDGITGVQQIKIAIIPGKEGRYTLPEISIPWWDIKTGQMQIATIKSRTFTVGQASAASTVIQPSPSDQHTQLPTQENQARVIAPDAVDTDASSSTLLWKIISLLLFCAWMYTLYRLWSVKRQSMSDDSIPVVGAPSLKQVHKLLDKACSNNDAQATRQGLLSWSRAIGMEPAINSLGELSTRVDDRLAQQIRGLNESLYKNTPGQWQCEGLPALCREYEKNLSAQPLSTKQEPQLEHLYK